MLDKIQSEHHGNMMSSAEQETTEPSTYDINGNLITPEWAALFAGFFWGEGCFMIEVTNHGRGFQPYSQIWLRDDERPILEEFMKRLGGRLQPYPTPSGGGNPQLAWRVANNDECVRIAELLKSTPSLPFQKREQLEVWDNALKIRKDNLGLKTNRDPDYFRQMSQLKKVLEHLRKYQIILS